MSALDRSFIKAFEKLGEALPTPKALDLSQETSSRSASSRTLHKTEEPEVHKPARASSSRHSSSASGSIYLNFPRLGKSHSNKSSSSETELTSQEVSASEQKPSPETSLVPKVARKKTTRRVDSTKKIETEEMPTGVPKPHVRFPARSSSPANPQAVESVASQTIPSEPTPKNIDLDWSSSGGKKLLNKTWFLDRPEPNAVIPSPHQSFEKKPEIDRSSHLSKAEEIHDPCGEPIKAGFEVPALPWPALVENLRAAIQNQWESLTDFFRVESEHGRNIFPIVGRGRKQGRTTACLTLARILSLSGRKVALVDGDFHHPRLLERLGLSCDTGWEEVLHEKKPLRDALIESLADRITLLPLRAALASQNIGANPLIRTSLLRLADTHDVVLVDTGSMSENITQTFIASLNAASNRVTVLAMLDSRDEDSGRDLERRLHESGLTHHNYLENFVPC